MSGRRKRGVPKPTGAQCIFCTTPCPPTFSILKGEVKKLKTDPPPVKKSADKSLKVTSPYQLTFLEEEDCSSLAAQLKVIFILKDILDLRKEKLRKFLGHFEGQLHPEFWFQTCGYCGEAVRVCYETSKEISRLQRKFNTIREELKGRILETKEEPEMGGQDEVVSSVWKEVREEFLKEGVEVNGPPTDADGDDNHDEENVKSNISDELQTVAVSPVQKAVKEELMEELVEDDHDDEEEEDDLDDEEDGSFNKISINGNIFADDEDDEEINDFLMGNPSPEDEESTGTKEEKSSLEKKEGRKQKLISVTPNACEEDIQFEVIVRDTRPPPKLEFKSYQKRKKGRMCYKCLSCPYFETLYLKRIKAHVKTHRPGVKISEDEKDDECGDEEKNSSGNEDQEESKIRINGSIFEEENDVEDEEDSESELSNYKMETEDPLKFTEEDRKGRKQKLVPISSSQSNLQLIPPPVIKEDPQYTTFRQDNRTFYRCSQCPATNVEWRLMFEHLNLHRFGSSAITCPTPDCGWALGPEKGWLTRHNMKFHRLEGPEAEAVKNVPIRARKTYFRCIDCEALFMGLRRLKKHYELHDSKGGVICSECGWLCSNLGNHTSFWHPAEGAKRAKR